MIKSWIHFVVYFETLTLGDALALFNFVTRCSSPFRSTSSCCFILCLRLTCNLNIIISNSCRVFVGLFLLSQIPFCTYQLVVLFSILRGNMDTIFLPNSKKSRKTNNDVDPIDTCFCLECFLPCIHHKCLCIECPN